MRTFFPLSAVPGFQSFKAAITVQPPDAQCFIVEASFDVITLKSNAMAIIEAIRDAWAWAGLEPDEVVAENDFGNLLVRDTGGFYWRICPEELGCGVVAKGREDLDELFADQEFLLDWQMAKLLALALPKLGKLPTGRKYCLKIPAMLGGAYEESNFGTVPLIELIRYSGDLARQIKDLPDGAHFSLSITD